MKLHDWKYMFADRILERGANYYRNGAVESLKRDGDTITALVSGTEDYDVEITVSGGDVTDLYCSCPYAEDGNNCKHMAAVLFALSRNDFFEDDFSDDDDGDDDYGDDDDDSGGRNSDSARNSATLNAKQAALQALQSAVQSLSTEDAKALLYQYAKKYAEIAEQVTLRATGTVTEAQIAAWTKQLNGLSRQYAGRDGYIDYSHARGYAKALKSLLNSKVQILLSCGMPLEAFDLTCRGFKAACESNADDSAGEMGGVCWTCAKLWRTIIEHADTKQRHKMFDWFDENFARWPMADDLMDDFLFGDAKEEGAFPGEEFLRRKLDLLDACLRKANNDEYDQERFLRYRLDIMEKLSVPRL